MYSPAQQACTSELRIHARPVVRSVPNPMEAPPARIDTGNVIAHKQGEVDVIWVRTAGVVLVLGVIAGCAAGFHPQSNLVEPNYGNTRVGDVLVRSVLLVKADGHDDAALVGSFLHCGTTPDELTTAEIGVAPHTPQGGRKLLTSGWPFPPASSFRSVAEESRRSASPPSERTSPSACSSRSTSPSAMRALPSCTCCSEAPTAIWRVMRPNRLVIPPAWRLIGDRGPRVRLAPGDLPAGHVSHPTTARCRPRRPPSFETSTAQWSPAAPLATRQGDHRGGHR
jgi:hypothetical protein